ncbi:MAG: MiaB/RimO family radical SAM methylthiotransferase [Actinobacteria bacterium]|nr:MAG: MiaB/RimO family radical SAM methylthiotransferase [Actinomycetota bacterium]
MRVNMAGVAVYTVGCKVNQAESDELRAGLQDAGHDIVRLPAIADLCVVNTCTVTAESDRKCRKLIRWLARRGARAIVVAGCYAEVRPGDLETLPGVLRVLPNARKDGWLREITSMLPEGGCGSREPETRRTRSFIKVQDGCERACSYCIVPLARGKERSRPVGEIMHEATRCIATGSHELVLCGINLGRYSQGTGRDLGYLVREVLSAGDGYRVRLSSIELEDLHIAWLRDWAGSDRICPHLHIPLQSGDDAILRDMGRGYTAEDFKALAGSLRAIWPEASLTTEVIVGYPGEDDEAFRRTVEVLSQVRPARVHVFRFSPRPGTRAWSRKDASDHVETELRSGILRELAEEWRLGYIEERGGELRDLLVEEVVVREGSAIARGTTEDFIKGTLFSVPSGIAAGEIVSCEICGVTGGRARLEAVEGNA